MLLMSLWLRLKIEHHEFSIVMTVSVAAAWTQEPQHHDYQPPQVNLQRALKPFQDPGGIW